MKAERRHELKTNTLARGLEGLPEASRRYGSRALLGVIAVLLVILLVRLWVTRSREAARDAATNLDSARRLIDQLPMLGAVGTSQRVDSGAVATRRDEIVNNAQTLIDGSLDKSSDPKVRAAAFIARGDLNWELANFPQLPGATTRPNLQLPQTSEAYLKAAEEAYQGVVNSGGGAPPEAGVFARLGLGAIAENRQQWDEAQKQYQAITDAEALPQPLRQLAADKLTRLADIRQPVVLGQPRPAPAAQQSLEEMLRQARAGTQPATQRSIMFGSGGATTTQPAAAQPGATASTQPAAPMTTQPGATTAPATAPQGGTAAPAGQP